MNSRHVFYIFQKLNISDIFYIFKEIASAEI